MSRLSAPLQPLWPLAKRAYGPLSVVAGLIFRRLGFLFGERRLPSHGFDQSFRTAAAEPHAVTMHAGSDVPEILRTIGEWDASVVGEFRGHCHAPPAATYVLDIAGGTTVGNLGATITPGGALDLQTSDYWDVRTWRAHPIFLAGRLPAIRHVGGTVAALATRGGNSNNYHFLFDVLPRLAVLRECLPDVDIDHYWLPRDERFHREILELAGLADLPVIDSRSDLALRADRLLVPSLPNDDEMAPPWVVEWLRNLLPAKGVADKPSRLYVTRGHGPNTRRLVQEAEVWPELEKRGFVRINPGEMPMRDQIDNFAAADVIVGLHGAALTNLVFCKPGVKVLHLMAPAYIKHCFWAILDSIADVDYQPLVTDGPRLAPGKSMTGVQHDLSIAATRLLAAVDELL